MKRKVLKDVIEFGSKRLLTVRLNRRVTMESNEWVLMKSEGRIYLLAIKYQEVCIGDSVICANKYYGEVVGLPGSTQKVTDLYDSSIGEVIELSDDQKKYLLNSSKDFSSRYLTSQVVVKIHEGSDNRYEVVPTGDVRVIVDMVLPDIKSITISGDHL